MARLPRPDLAGIAQHVVQRGNNRMLCFLDDEDRQRYLAGLRDALQRFDCALHAYVLMSNHVHLLITPRESGGLSRLMQYFGRGYAQLFNGRHRRSGAGSNLKCNTEPLLRWQHDNELLSPFT